MAGQSIGASLSPAPRSPLQLAGNTGGNSGLAGPSPKESKFKTWMQAPDHKAFMMQVAASLLAGAGLGQSLSDGLGARGRYAVADEQFKRRSAEDAMKAADKASRGRGGGGGGGGGTGTDTKANKALWDSYGNWQGYYADLGVSEDPGELAGLAWIQALHENGNSAPLDAYNSMDEESRKAFVQEFAGGPEAGLRRMKEWESSNAAPDPTTPVPDPNAPAPTPELKTMDRETGAPNNTSGWLDPKRNTQGLSWGSFWPWGQ